MHTRILMTTLVTLLLSVGRIPAQTYEIKVKTYPSAGKSAEVDDTETTRTSISVTLNGNVLKDEKKKETAQKQYTEKTLVDGDKKPAKYSKTFSKASKKINDGEPANLSYAGKTIVFELQGDKYKVTPDNEIDPKDLDAFIKQANKPDPGSVVLPKQPVKVGETWTLGKEALALLGDVPEDAIDMTKLKGIGKFVKAYKKGSQQWGTIEVTITAPLIKFGPLPVDKAIDVQMKVRLDAAIDGSPTAAEMSGYVAVKGRTEFTQNNMTFQIDVDIAGELRRKVGAEK